LVLGALVHDLGKGSERDHTAVGVDLAKSVATRIGCDEDDTATLVAMVEHHLLLSDVASRRDLDDSNTIRRVADAVGSVPRLHLLAGLTEADAKATGPAAWSPWKAELVRQLVERVEAYLSGTEAPSSTTRPWPSPEDVESLTGKGHHVEASKGVVTVCTPDRPGVFSRVAGALALRGLDVVDAIAFTTGNGYALERFRVLDPLRDETPWDKVVRDLELALDGRLAIAARMAERVKAQRRRPLDTVRANVHFDNEASDDATVIDVEAPDVVGMLYRITRAFSELDLDIRSARVQTLGPKVVDAFYVVDRAGNKLVEPAVLAEIERAVVHGVAEGLQ
jgi:[protein-PII] uridylyltransferase